MAPWILVALALFAHFGLRLAFYNRLNSLGWRRRTIKRVEKIAFVETFVTPLLIVSLWYAPIERYAISGGGIDVLPWGLRWYAGFHLLVGGVLLLDWIRWRPIFGLQRADVKRFTQIHRADREAKLRFARSDKCRVAARIPGNQIFDLAVERIEVRLNRLPPELDGYRIAHLSDIHLTGDLEPESMAEVIGHAMSWHPEMFVLTGDIVDVNECVEWLPGLFSSAAALDGGFFILGNHDTRVSDPQEVRDAMQSAGWHDMGGRCQTIRMRQTEVMMMGNEWPWFGRPSDSEIERAAGEFDTPPLRFCLSHSPDQFPWSRRHDVDLLLAGHTHGGQGRLPLAGPILSPSWYGSRWASGDFYRPPTTMHVSRGLGGVHLLRIHCRPELSLLTLRCGEG